MRAAQEFQCSAVSTACKDGKSRWRQQCVYIRRLLRGQSTGWKPKILLYLAIPALAGLLQLFIEHLAWSKGDIEAKTFQRDLVR